MDSRKYDLEELMGKRRLAKNAFERDLVDRTVDKIMRESGAVRERRDKLISAIRNNDRRAVERFKQELMMLRANDTYGKDY